MIELFFMRLGSKHLYVETLHRQLAYGKTATDLFCPKIVPRFAYLEKVTIARL